MHIKHIPLYNAIIILHYSREHVDYVQLHIIKPS